MNFIPGVFLIILSILMTVVGLITLLITAIPRPRKNETIKDRKDKAIGGGVIGFLGIIIFAYTARNFNVE